MVIMYKKKIKFVFKELFIWCIVSNNIHFGRFKLNWGDMGVSDVSFKKQTILKF